MVMEGRGLGLIEGKMLNSHIDSCCIKSRSLTVYLWICLRVLFDEARLLLIARFFFGMSVSANLKLVHIVPKHVHIGHVLV